MIDFAASIDSSGFICMENSHRGSGYFLFGCAIGIINRGRVGKERKDMIG